MKLSKELSDKIKYDLPAEVVEMRFELFDWLKEKGLCSLNIYCRLSDRCVL